MKSVYFNSSSETIKAKKLLAKNNIKTDIVKATDGGAHGCVYALRFDDIYLYSVCSILSQNNYEYKRNNS